MPTHHLLLVIAFFLSSMASINKIKSRRNLQANDPTSTFPNGRDRKDKAEKVDKNTRTVTCPSVPLNMKKTSKIQMMFNASQNARPIAYGGI